MAEVEEIDLANEWTALNLAYSTETEVDHEYRDPVSGPSRISDA
jgi:hypothetical protein